MPRPAPYAPHELRAVANQLGETFLDAENQIIARLRDGDLTEWSRARLRQQAAQINAMLGQLRGEVEDWAQVHVPDLYSNGMAQAIRDYRGPATFTAPHVEAINLLGENLSLDLGRAINFVGRNVDDVFRRAGLESVQRGFVTGQTRRQQSREMVKTLLDRGVTSFEDKSGRRWGLGYYSEMVGRTTSREACQAGFRNTMSEIGEDLARITSHPGACPKCAPWQGRIISLSGETKGYPTLGEAQGSGYNHPNCLHTEVAHFVDIWAFKVEADRGTEAA